MRLLESNTFGVVIADVGLPVISGLDLCRQVRAARPETLVVMISGRDAAEAEASVKAAGAFAFLSKPFDLNEVLATVDRAREYYVHSN
jgi:DNA-binding response OmpR family regulator